MPVPSLVDAASPDYSWRDHEYHWYRLKFTVDSSVERETALLRLEQAMYGTAVYLNGTRIGSDIACYTSQEYDVRRQIRYAEENELLVRVGQRKTLPPESAVGNDQERKEFVPGIWGDVELVCCGNPRIRLVQIIPQIASGIAEAKLWIENSSSSVVTVAVTARVVKKKSGSPASHPVQKAISVPAKGACVETLETHIDRPLLWSPERPFLYVLEASVKVEGVAVDYSRTTFGMREFSIKGGDFLFNGRKVRLRGGNIALHRFFADPDRGTLPWDMDWVKRVLIDIPREHNFNFFRSHLGQLYNRWYDIADEHGMLIQNEWPFWRTSGTKEQIRKEFTRWLQDNWNHPSIIIWDALNECSDDIVQREIVPEMKRLDPTRPWESVDIHEQHPYIYSLGPVLNEGRFGFTRGLSEIEHSSTPSMVNEFLWWWLNRDGNPTSLTQEVIERWLGKHHTKEDVIQWQSFLASELVELFRRMNVDAIQPFVYLSNKDGPTGDWFLGDIKELKPKPVMQALRNAFAPFGLSLELWDRHFFSGEKRTIRVFVFNDTQKTAKGTICWGVASSDDTWIWRNERKITVPPVDTLILPLDISIPVETGAFEIRAELNRDGERCAVSRKSAYVMDGLAMPPSLAGKQIAVLAQEREVMDFLLHHGVKAVNLRETDLRFCDALIVGEGMVQTRSYQPRLGAVTKFLQGGKSIVLLEPEYGITEKESFDAALGVELVIERREDADRGGYDSYLFAEDIDHPLWDGLSADHLKMFNGGYGGEVVSQHNVLPNVPYSVLARCGLHLAVSAVWECHVGAGRLIVSRLQLRGRLMRRDSEDGLFSRRADPVAQRYLLNLAAYASGIR
ncbi:MAG: glycoside hydrolase family 2 TIM barrel-domain containing protein [Bacteroidota bacterium]